jgi:adenine deaminase
LLARRDDVMDVLLGGRPADLVVANGRVVDVHRGAIVEADVAVCGDRIARVGTVDDLVGPRTRTVDADGRFVTPGLIEPHVHAYHAQLNFTEYARLVLRRGTTATAESCYFAGQMAGVEGVRFFLDEMRNTPLTVLFVVPALAYLMNRELGIDPLPNALQGDELLQMLDWEGFVGVEEPPYIPVLERDPHIARLIEAVLARGGLFMGHGAGLTPAELEVYAAMGVTADHECLTAEEALERLRLGMMVGMRECAIGPNQSEVQKAITEYGSDPDAFMYCGDGIDAVTVSREGYLDHCIRLAIDAGIDPITAVQMGTLNPARYYRVDDRLGSITPGRQADILLVGSLEAFDVQTVIAKGRPVVEDGEWVVELDRPLYPRQFRDSVRLARPVRPEDLRVYVADGQDTAVVRAMGAETLVSDERHVTLPVVDGSVVADVGQDVLKIAMWDRYARRELPAVAFLQGYGLTRGAFASSYNPFFNNIMALGVSDADLALAANVVAEMKGGFAVVADGEVIATVELPLLGLLSDATAEELTARMIEVTDAVAALGCRIESPFANFALCAVVGEVPYLKMSDRGLFDVIHRRVLPTLVSDGEPITASAEPAVVA